MKWLPSIFKIERSHIRATAATNAGYVRLTNQDAYCLNSSADVWAVADGMGGHHDGERASELIVKAFEAIPYESTFATRLNLAHAAIATANRAIFDEAQENGRQMGSTIVALVTGEDRYAILWAGDSRAYLKRGDAITLLTRDHSQAQEMVAAGVLGADMVTGHASSHVLVRAVGVQPEVDVDQVEGALYDQDMFLLCSDGLHNLVSEVEMLKTMTLWEFNRVSEQLVFIGLERGAPDNITACVVSFGRDLSGSFQQ